MKYSFEFFPPKSEEMEQKLWQTVKELEHLNPEFVSVTYGAGGSTRGRTYSTIQRILQETNLKPAAHLTCVNATRAEINEVAKEYWDAGVKHIVALRGDPPEMNGEYEPHPDGYQYAADLVAGLRKVADFELSVAAYPETHPQAKSADDDLRHLKEKMDAGATRAITQYFFDVNDYLDFADRAAKIGITAPIVPGLMPIGNFAQAVKFSKMCGAKIPVALAKRYEEAGDDAENVADISVETTTDTCLKLAENGLEQLHFYTLNRADLVKRICDNI